MITQSRLHELFDYDPETGNLIRKVATSKRVKVGDVAGCIKPTGYRHVCVDGRMYQAHRLVWMYHHGKFPDLEIDHINRVRNDNRIENLRDVSRTANSANRDRPNKTGYVGVSKLSKKRFQTHISIFGNKVHLGFFTTPEEAHHVFKRVHFDLHREQSPYAPEFAELAA